MTKIALPTAALLLVASLAGCAQERSPAASGTSARPMAAPAAQPMMAPGAAQPMTTPQPMSGTLGSGTTVPPVDLPTEQRIRNRLAADGYNDVSNLQRDVGGYTAKAVKDGKVVEVMVDEDGKVTRMR
jgi:hypothetical protein